MEIRHGKRNNEGGLTIGSVEIIDISVSEGAASDRITADTNAVRDIGEQMLRLARE